MPSATLSNAMVNKEDEFYTLLEPIEKELRHYKKHFKDKVVLCNCDDPYESNFFKYFALNFNYLGLKKLIATCYATSSFAYGQISIFDIVNVVNPVTEARSPYKIEITEVDDVNNDGAVNLADVEHLIKNEKNVLTLLEGDGDFRSDECLALLDEADIVVTNPPFSLLKEFIAVLIEHKKDFLIIGNQNNITYKDIFPLLMENKVWLGYGFGDMVFKVPSHYEPRETRFWIDETGQKYRSLGNICWFTNLDILKRHEDIDLYRKYSPEEYPYYDNYNAINVSKVSEIPEDFEGVMGVPITFLDKYNPNQFEILGLAQKVGFGLESTKTYDDFKEIRQNGTFTGSSGKKTNGNPVMAGKPAKGNYYVKGDEVVHSLYARIFIRNKNPKKRG